MIFRDAGVTPAWVYLAAVKNGKWQDMLVMGIATIGVTIPSFVIASHFDLCIFISAELAADLRTGQLEGVSSSGYYPGRLFRQLSGAPDAFQPSGGDGTGLHPDCTGERSVRDKGHLQACTCGML